MSKPDLWKTIGRGIRFRCPGCGEGKVAKSWRETCEECSHCGLDFRVEGGFYLGSIYVNYGIIGGLFLVTGLPLVWFGYVSPWVATTVGVLVGVPLSVWFWRYARSLWLCFGYVVDPEVRLGKRGANTTNASPAEGPADGSPNAAPGFEFVCPFCHSRSHVDEAQRNSWGVCDVCGEKTLFMSVAAAALNRGSESI